MGVKRRHHGKQWGGRAWERLIVTNPQFYRTPYALLRQKNKCHKSLALPHCQRSWYGGYGSQARLSACLPSCLDGEKHLFSMKQCIAWWIAHPTADLGNQHGGRISKMWMCCGAVCVCMCVFTVSVYILKLGFKLGVCVGGCVCALTFLGNRAHLSMWL